MRVLISYRRDDSAPWAGRLRDALGGAFGARNVFVDLDSIPSGAPFAERIAEGARRLDLPDDPVGVEIRQALAAGEPMVPVPVGGAAMPRRDALPADLRSVCGLNAAEISDPPWDHDARVPLPRPADSRIFFASAGI